MRADSYCPVRRLLSVGAASLLFCFTTLAQTPPVRLRVDATDAPRKLLHARLSFPATPGPLTLVYPKWPPGEHSPAGPIADLTGLAFSAGGHTIEWRRDAEDMFAFHLTVPRGTEFVEASLDFLLKPSNGDSTSQLLVLDWSKVLLYPKGSNAARIQFAASLKLPEGWKFGTPLQATSQSQGTADFATVSLETLVDSPVLAGRNFRTVDLTPGASPSHVLDLAADSHGALEMRPEDLRRFSQLVAEAGELFGARHYRAYHFLVAMSDRLSCYSLEHHECSDDHVSENFLTDPSNFKLDAALLPHEYVHSWNGKYRRPSGLVAPDYQQAVSSELLWVYEGLADYLSLVLTVRSGLWTQEDFRGYLGVEAGHLEYRPGRNWRSLADTSVAAQLLFEARPEGSSWRRGVDFYEEGDLLWLEADMLIRQQTQGRKTLDDFCKSFFGGQSGPPKVVPYTLDDLLSALKEVAPCDWATFFRERVYAVTAHPPLRGLELAGWRLVYTNTAPEWLELHQAAHNYMDFSFSLGLVAKGDGYISDVLPGSPAHEAGLGVAMKLEAVNGQDWTPANLCEAVEAAARLTGPISLSVRNDNRSETHRLDYHGGERYPVLERIPGRPDLLLDVLKPRTDPTPTSPAEGRVSPR